MQQKQQRFTRSLELVVQNSCDLIGVEHHANHVPFLQRMYLVKHKLKYAQRHTLQTINQLITLKWDNGFISPNQTA